MRPSADIALAAAGLGHNHPPLSIDERRAAYHEGVKRFMAIRRVAIECAQELEREGNGKTFPAVSDALTPEEIAQLPMIDRLDAQRKALILNLAEYYRRNPKADAAPGVLALITFFSDNPTGKCTLSQSTIAKILNRSRQAIVEAFFRLRKCGALLPGSGQGAISVAVPVIPRIFGISKELSEREHMTWLLPALKGEACQGEPTSQVKPTSSTCQGEPTCQVKPTSPTCQGEPTSSIPTCQDKPTPLVKVSRHNFSSLNSGGEEEERHTPRAHAREADCVPVEAQPFGLEEEDFREFHEGMNAWIASDPLGLAAKQQRSFTDSHLAKLFRAWCTGYAPQIALAAFRSVNCKASTTAAKRNPAFQGYLNFIETCMQGSPNKPGALETIATSQGRSRSIVVGEQGVQAVRVNTQTAIGGQQIAAHGTAIETNAANRLAAPAKANCAAAPAAAERFDDDAKKVDDVRGTWIDGFRCNQILDDIPGSTKRMIRDALTKVGSECGEKPDPDDVVQAVRRRVLFAIHGTPENRCGGTPGVFAAREFRIGADVAYSSNCPARSTWFALSQETIDKFAALYPEANLAGVFCNITDELPRRGAVGASRYMGLQAELEAEFEQGAKASHKSHLAEIAKAADAKFGVERLNDRVALTRGFSRTSHRDSRRRPGCGTALRV